ncbi:hypothetical protein [Slackia heliotrinireducens]|uniref:hypothetical protein n=1 Tax=Slackia heliotrinireducens TaxID=84110 RepID=UPI003314AFD0
MHDLNRNLFYKTSFDIESVKPGTDVLWQLMMSIRYWMVGKWNREGEVVPEAKRQWGAFKSGAVFTSLDEAKTVRFESAVFWDEPVGTQWACAITETIADPGYAHRQWTTEIGFTKTGECAGTVSLVLSYGDQPGFLGPRQQIPEESIPRIVRILNGNINLACSIDGRPLVFGAQALHVGDFPKFWEVVSNADRSVPVIYVSPRFVDGRPEFAVDPQAVARVLGTSALVYYTCDPDFCEEMEYGIPSHGLRCSNGMVRAYTLRPNFDDPEDAVRHRFFTTSDVQDMGAEVLLDLFRQVYAQDVNFYEQMVRIDDVRTKVRRASLEKRAQRRIEAVEEEAISIASDIEEGLLEVQRENDRLTKALAEVENERHLLAAKNEMLEYRLKGGADAAEAQRVELNSWPMSPREVAELFLRVYPDRIAFTGRGFRSLDECSTNSETVWNALYDLCTIAHGLLRSQGGVDPAREFNDRSRFEYARGAGMMTRKNAKLMEDYVDEYEGRSLEAQMHLKSGIKESDDRFMRMYFGYDQVSGKIVISHVGKHLATYSARTLK